MAHNVAQKFAHNFSLAAIAAALLLPLLPATSAIAADQALDKWKQGIFRDATALGISQKTLVNAIANTRPNYKLPRVRTHRNWARLAAADKKRKQAPIAKRPTKDGLPASCHRPRQSEFLFPTLYFPPGHMKSLVNRGKALRAKYRDTFARIEQQYDVDIKAVLAIWGRETAFGAAKNKFDGIRTLMSLAYAGPKAKRPAHRQNLLRALKFIDEGHISLSAYKVSFAGATGYPQFTPDVFERYAVDFDGDGRKNIWSSVPDAVASAAKYLKGIGWQSGQTWGYEVNVPNGFDCSDETPKGRKPLSEWIKLGARRVPGPDGQPRSFRDKTLLAQFMAPAGMMGPKFLVLENFEVFRRYNKADLYALFVGHLADRMGCYKSDAACGFKGGWPRKDEFNFTRKRICEMQIHLKRLGASDETPDGLFGGKTRRGIGTWERRNARTPTCFPSKAMLQSLRQQDPIR